MTTEMMPVDAPVVDVQKQTIMAVAKDRTEESHALVANPREVPRQRDDGVTLIGLYHFLVAGVWLLATLIFAFPTLILGIIGLAEDPDAWIGMFFTGFFSLIFMILCVFYLAVGYGLWTQRQWGRTAAVALSIVRLMLIPIGTIIGGLMLWHLLKERVAAQFR